MRCTYNGFRKDHPNFYYDLGTYEALREAIQAKDLERARTVHSTLKLNQQDGVTFLGNLVVQMYGCCGSIHESKQAFDAIHNRNIFSWNIMLSALAQNKHLEESKLAFQKMPCHNTVSWNSMAAALTQCGHFEDARGILWRMPEKSTVSWNALLGLYAQTGHTKDAKRVFDEMPVRDSLSWNTLISSYMKNKEEFLMQSALHVFERSPQYSVVSWNSIVVANAVAGHLDYAFAQFRMMPERDVISWNTIVVGLANSGRTNEAKLILQKMPLQDNISRIAVASAEAQSGQLQTALSLFERTRDAVLGTSLISGYTSSNKLQEARHLFSLIKSHDVVSWTTMISGYAANQHLHHARRMFDLMPQRDIVSWTSIISGYAQAGQLSESRRLFLASPHRDGISYNAMIQAYVVSGSLSQARAFFEEMCVDGQHNRGSWNAMIAAYSQAGDPESSHEAMTMFRRMDLEGFPADCITLISALDACARVAALELGKMIHDEAIHRRLNFDVGVATQLVDMYAKCGELQSSRRVFDTMPERNLLTWNTMIGAYHGHGRRERNRTGNVDHVLGLFLCMVVEGFEPSDVTLLSVISSLGHAGICHYFVSSFVDFGVVMKLDHYQCVIDLFSRLGELGVSEELIQEMPVEPDLTAWKTLLSACRDQGDCELASKVAIKIRELDPDDVSMYSLLANTWTADL